jgi:hypothetical protein
LQLLIRTLLPSVAPQHGKDFCRKIYCEVLLNVALEGWLWDSRLFCISCKLKCQEFGMQEGCQLAVAEPVAEKVGQGCSGFSCRARWHVGGKLFVVVLAGRQISSCNNSGVRGCHCTETH